MPELDDALVELSSWLSENEIGHMVIGGFAVTIWGEPRFTRDLDVTVSVPAHKFVQTIHLTCARFHSLSGDPLQFVTETRVLPILVEAVPVDLIFAALPYEEDAIARARPIHLKDGSVPVCSPEDLILHKIVSQRPRDLPGRAGRLPVVGDLRHGPRVPRRRRRARRPPAGRLHRRRAGPPWP